MTEPTQPHRPSGDPAPSRYREPIGDRAPSRDPEPIGADAMIIGLQQAHARLFERLSGLTDDVAGRPSLLPGWTVAHVMAHVARNADSVVRRLEGAARGEIVDQYPGGARARAAEIEASAGMPAAALVDDVRTTGLAVEQVASRLTVDAWSRLTRSLDGRLLTAATVLGGRVREVELHHADLGLGYEPGDWPADFVQDLLRDALHELPARTDPAVLVAWITGRGPAPVLPPWR